MKPSAVVLPLSRVPVRLVATAVTLAVSLAAGVLIHWVVAVALLALGLVIIHRPLDLFLTCVLITAASTFVNNEGGHLTRDLSLVTLMCLYGLFCLQVYAATGRWTMPRSQLTIAVLGFGATTAVAVAIGVAAHNSLKFLGLELFPMLAFFTALVVGGLRAQKQDLRMALLVLVAVGLAHVGLGIDAYVVNRVRTGGISFTLLPGLVALVVLNLALRSHDRRTWLMATGLLGLLLFHQVISFTRGYWLGLMAGIPFSCALYGRSGRGAGRRWARVGKLVFASILMVMVGVIVFGLWFGWSDILAIVARRFVSSLVLSGSDDSASNIARLVEYGESFRYIAAAPWLGHGLGFTLLVRQPMYGITTTQWYVHESYLHMWLKEGLVGLIALIGLLFAGLRLGIRGAMALDDEAAAWSAAAASCTVYVIVHAFTNMTFGVVNGNFLIALLWGIALSLSRTRPASLA